MRSLSTIKTYFGFDNLGFGVYDPNIEHPELVDLCKRVKRKYPFATFAGSAAGSTLAIKLTQASLCWDVIVRFVPRCDGYVVKTVSTNRERPISYEDMHRYYISNSVSGVDDEDIASISITQNINRVMKLIYDTRSITTQLVLDKNLEKTLIHFERGLVHAQDKLTALKHQVFHEFDLYERDGALLEYGLAGIEGRAVRADIQHSVEEMVREYIKEKTELGESVTASEGLQVLSLFKLQDDGRVYYHYEGIDAGDMVRNNHVNDVNELPQEVLSKLAVLQITGTEAAGYVGSGGCKILNSIGAVGKPHRGGFVEDSMCVYITPETMVEVQALAGK